MWAPRKSPGANSRSPMPVPGPGGPSRPTPGPAQPQGSPPLLPLCMQLSLLHFTSRCNDCAVNLVSPPAAPGPWALKLGQIGSLSCQSPYLAPHQPCTHRPLPEKRGVVVGPPRQSAASTHAWSPPSQCPPTTQNKAESHSGTHTSAYLAAHLLPTRAACSRRGCSGPSPAGWPWAALRPPGCGTSAPAGRWWWWWCGWRPTSIYLPPTPFLRCGGGVVPEAGTRLIWRHATSLPRAGVVAACNGRCPWAWPRPDAPPPSRPLSMCTPTGCVWRPSRPRRPQSRRGGKDQACLRHCGRPARETLACLPPRQGDDDTLTASQPPTERNVTPIIYPIGRAPRLQLHAGAGPASCRAPRRPPARRPQSAPSSTTARATPSRWGGSAVSGCRG